MSDLPADTRFEPPRLKVPATMTAPVVSSAVTTFSVIPAPPLPITNRVPPPQGAQLPPQSGPVSSPSLTPLRQSGPSQMLKSPRAHLVAPRVTQTKPVWQPLALQLPFPAAQGHTEVQWPVVPLAGNPAQASAGQLTVP